MNLRHRESLWLCCFVAIAQVANGVILSWTGTSSEDWGTAENWSPERIPVDGDSLYFVSSAAAVTNNNLSGTLEVDDLFFANATDGYDFTVNGNGIRVTGSIGTEVVTDTSTDTITDTLNTDIEFVGSSIEINTSTGHNLVLNGQLSGGTQLVYNDGGNGAGDDGEVTLAGANSYTGGSRLNGGTLRLLHNAALGTGALSIEDRSNTNPLLVLGADGLLIGNDLTLTNQGSNKRILLDLAGSGTAELSGAIVLNETGSTNNRFIVGEDDVLTLSGDISGPGRLSLFQDAGGGTLVLSGNNSHGGGVLVREGSLVIASDNALGTGLLTIEDRGVNPVILLTDGRMVANEIIFSNRGATRRLNWMSLGLVLPNCPAGLQSKREPVDASIFGSVIMTSWFCLVR